MERNETEGENTTLQQEQPVAETPNIAPEPAHNPTNKPKEGGLGPIIGIIIIIILLALGAMYYFTAGLEQIQDAQPNTGEGIVPRDDAAALLEQSDSTDIDAIETDLEGTDLTGLDDALAEFEAELAQ